MDALIFIMIVLGSLLMIYNIFRYGVFIKRSNDLDHQTSKKGIILIPLFLLIFFLIGYLVIGISGIANLMVAAILLGGSIFVFLLLWVMLSIIRHTRDTENILAARYTEIKSKIESLTKDSMAVFVVNLTKDEIVERSGEFLYDTDFDHDRYSDLIESRQKNILNVDYPDTHRALFKRDGLLKHFKDGQTNASEILLVRRRDGVASFVKFEATLTEMPVTGDVMAFIIEKPCNEEVVRKTLLEKVLMDEYDRIAYIVNGRYKVLISNTGKKEGMLLTNDDEDSYESLYFNYFLPALPKELRTTADHPNPLRLSIVEKEVFEKGVYTVTLPFIIEGMTHYKQFVFYRIDEKAGFFLMMLSDVTGMRKESSAVAEPQPKSAPKPQPEPLSVTETAAEPENNVPPLSLLVVDDNDINREIANLMLTSEGHTVTLACDGAEALKLVAESDPGKFDVVLMDVNMPVMNGYEATAAIRTLPDKTRAGVPIIAMTAGAFQEDWKDAEAAGMDGFVTKPVSPDELHTALNKAITERT